MTEYRVRLWDRNLNFIGEVTQGWRVDEPTSIAILMGSELGQAFSDDHDGWPEAYLTVDYPTGGRWTGRLRNFQIIRPFGTERYIVAHFYDTAPSREALEKILEWLRKLDEND